MRLLWNLKPSEKLTVSLRVCYWWRKLTRKRANGRYQRLVKSSEEKPFEHASFGRDFHLKGGTLKKGFYEKGSLESSLRKWPKRLKLAHPPRRWHHVVSLACHLHRRGSWKDLQLRGKAQIIEWIPKQNSWRSTCPSKIHPHRYNPKHSSRSVKTGLLASPKRSPNRPKSYFCMGFLHHFWQVR